MHRYLLLSVAAASIVTGSVNQLNRSMYRGSDNSSALASSDKLRSPRSKSSTAEQETGGLDAILTDFCAIAAPSTRRCTPSANGLLSFGGSDSLEPASHFALVRIASNQVLFQLLTQQVKGASDKNHDVEEAKKQLDKNRKSKIVDEQTLLNKNMTAAEQLVLLQDIKRLNAEIGALKSKMDPALSRSTEMRDPTELASSALPDLEEGISLSAEFQSIADEITGPLEQTLDTYNKLAGAITNRQDPPKPETPYSVDGFATQVQGAADKLAALPLNPDVDPTKYSVSLSQLASCVTQDSALSTLHLYANDMDEAVAKAKSNIDYLSKFRQDVAQLSSLTQAFSKAAAIGTSIPDLEWSGYFSSLWWDLTSISAQQ